VAPKDSSTRDSSRLSWLKGQNRYLLIYVVAAAALGLAGVALYAIDSDRPWVQAWIPAIAGALIVGALAVLVLEIAVKTAVADEQQRQLKPLREAADRELADLHEKVDRFLEKWQYVIGELRGDYPEVVREEDGGAAFPEPLVSRLPTDTHDLLWSGWGQPYHDKVLAQPEWGKAEKIASQIKRQSDRIVEWYSRALDPPIPAALGQIQEYLLATVENMPRTGRTDWFHDEGVHREFLRAYREVWPKDAPTLEAAREEAQGTWLAISGTFSDGTIEWLEERRSYMDPLLVGLYDALNPSGPREDYYLELVTSARAVLDLGCGTGRLLKHAARRRSDPGPFFDIQRVLIGVDRASAILPDTKPIDHDISWEDSTIVWQWDDMRTVDLARRFDLITMTGRTFQELLTDGDIRMVLTNVLRHLDPGGRFAFDVHRRGDEPLESLLPGPSAIRVTTSSGECVDVLYAPERTIEPDLLEFTMTYTFAGSPTPVVSRNTLRFIDPNHLRALLEDVGLRIDGWFGGWDRVPFPPSSGAEDVVVATRVH
jgi:SAM-dependent methyltransferase